MLEECLYRIPLDNPLCPIGTINTLITQGVKRNYYINQSHINPCMCMCVKVMLPLSIYLSTKWLIIKMNCRNDKCRHFTHTFRSVMSEWNKPCVSSTSITPLTAAMNYCICYAVCMKAIHDLQSSISCAGICSNSAKTDLNSNKSPSRNLISFKTVSSAIQILT